MNYKAQLQELKQAGSLTPERETHLTNAIKRAEITVEYKTDNYDRSTDNTASVIKNLESKYDGRLKVLKSNILSL